MTSTIVASLPAPATVPAATPAPFGARTLAGLAGVLLAVVTAQLNDHVTESGMPDIRGALGVSYDDGTWLSTAYQITQVSAMMFAPWCSGTFSLRRFTIGAITAFALLGIALPFAPAPALLLPLRALQGLAGGCLPPMLMTVALRFLPPGIKLYGLAAYALTATFAPNLGSPLAALWTEYVGWRFLFWQIVPLSLLSIGMIAWGLPQDPMRLERFRQFDWRGVLLGCPAIGMLVTAFEQGTRLGWNDSPLICRLFVAGLGLLVLFLVNEWFHPVPFFKIQLLARRNLTHALITLGGVMATRALAGAAGAAFSTTAISSAASIVPPGRQGVAISVVIAGLSLSTALGAPIGALIGGLGDWHWTMVFVAGLAAAAAVGVAALLSHIPMLPPVSLAQRLAPLSDRRVGLILSSTFLFFTAAFTIYTYLSVVFAQAIGGSPLVLSGLLVLWGAAGTVSNVLVGRLVDKIGNRKVLLTMLSFVAVDFVLLPWTSGSLFTAIPAIVVWGFCGWGMLVPQQHRIVSTAPHIAPIVLGLNNSATFLGTTAAGVLGALTIPIVGGARLGFVAAAFAVCSLVVAELASRAITAVNHKTLAME